MLKRITTVLLLGGLVGLVPAPAQAAPAPPAEIAKPASEHRSCWYYSHRYGWYRARCGRHHHNHDH